MAGPVAKVGIAYVIESDVNPPDITGAITFHVQKGPAAEPFGATDRADLADRVWQWWADHSGVADADGDPARNHFPFPMRIDRIDVWAVEPTPDGPTTFDPGADPDRYGTSGDALAAPQVAQLIHMNTSLESRRGRGRMYWPATGTGFGVSLGLVIEPVQLELGRIAANLGKCILQDPESTDPWVLCVYSPTDHDSHAVINFWIPDRVVTQRRRMTPAQFYRVIGLSGDPVV